MEMSNTSEDQALIAKTLEFLPDQISHTLEQSADWELPENYFSARRVIVCGMGGSNLGAAIVKSLFKKELKTPLDIVAHYELPAYAGTDTLCLLSSYSGNTEEVLAAAAEAETADCLTAVVTANHEDNKLAELAKQKGWPVIAFTPEYNPSGQPRLSLGYSIFAIALTLKKAELLELESAGIKTAVGKLKEWGELLKPEIADNDAQTLADKLFGKQILLIGPDWLKGSLHALRNQLNENSKHFASYLYLPDLNHHAMEGLKKPDSNPEAIKALIFDSELSHPRVAKRSELTKQVLEKNNIPSENYRLKGDSKIEQALEMLQLGSWLTYYLAEKNEVNPMDIPFVDWFKNELK